MKATPALTAAERKDEQEFWAAVYRLATGGSSTAAKFWLTNRPLAKHETVARSLYRLAKKRRGGA